MSMLRRPIVLPILVIGSLLAALTASIATGAEQPYPAVALDSGLLLKLERAVAMWAMWLLALVVGDQSLRGKLPDEISGRGVRYVPQERLDEIAAHAFEAGNTVGDRLDEIEEALACLVQPQRNS